MNYEGKKLEYEEMKKALKAMNERELLITAVFYLKDIKDRLERIIDIQESIL